MHLMCVHCYLSFTYVYYEDNILLITNSLYV